LIIDYFLQVNVIIILILYLKSFIDSRELTRTNHELRKLVHAGQRKFLEHMNVAEADIAPLLSAENLNEVLKVNRENSFLREKLNRYLGKPEVSAPSPQAKLQAKGMGEDNKRVPGVDAKDAGEFKLMSPDKNKNKWNKAILPNRVVPLISRDTALKLVLHEVKRLSSSFVELKEQQSSLKKHVNNLFYKSIIMNIY